MSVADPQPVEADPRAGARWQDPTQWRLRLGLMLSAHQLVGTPPATLFRTLASLAQSAEAVGYDSLWVPDHFIQMTPDSDAGEASLEAYTTLAALAVATEKVMLGTAVSSVTHRHAPVLAKQVVTIDMVSEGRAVLGIGRGWAEDEHEAYGIPFGSARQRSEQLEETLLVCRSMFTQERTSFHGKHLQVEALNVPVALSRYGPPIMVGGNGPKFTLPLVARYADICNSGYGNPEEVKEVFAYVDGLCEEYGRDPGSLWRTQLKPISIGPTREAAEQGWSDVERRMLERYGPITGTHSEVVDQLRPYLEVGVGGFVAVMPYSGMTADHIERVAAALDEVLPAP